jgi:2-methylisocitrate lyase-like PEP mutase family enzyme
LVYQEHDDMLTLSAHDRAMLDGDLGPGVALAMRIVTRIANVMSARELIAVTSAHIDGCLYHGATSLDFVERFVQAGTKVVIPTTLNVGSLDLIHPELYHGPASTGKAAQVTLLRLAMGAAERGLRALASEGTQKGLLEQMQSRAELYELMGYDDYTAFDASLGEI